MKRCGECGSTNISLKNAKGKFFAFKDHKRVPLTTDYEVRTCDKCENMILSNKNIWELNELLEKSIKSLAQTSINEIMNVNQLRQIDVAEMIGQTPQYISHLKSGSKVSSFSTLTLIRIFAKYPDIMEEFTGFKSHAQPMLTVPEFIESTTLSPNQRIAWRKDLMEMVASRKPVSDNVSVGYAVDWPILNSSNNRTNNVINKVNYKLNVVRRGANE